MDMQTIQDIFKPNWVFRLFTDKRIPAAASIAVIVVGPIIVFGLIAALLGEFKLYAMNPLSYSGPIWTGLALLAYNWFTQAFPRTILMFTPALEASEDEIITIIKTWARRVANRWSIMIIMTIPLSIAAIQDTVTLWSGTTTQWMGTPWVTQSAHSLFFAIVWSFYYGGVVSFMLGSGIVGIAGCALLINALLKLPLKLEYYRRLRTVLDLSTGIGLWTFVSFSITVIGQAFIKPNSSANLLTSSLFLSVAASISLMVAFVSPLLPARAAIIQAKQKKLDLYEKRLHEIAEDIDRLIAKQENKALEDLQKDRDLVKKQMEEVESIPEWPITVMSVSKIVSASIIMPFLNGIPEMVKGNLTDYISNIFKP